MSYNKWFIHSFIQCYQNLEETTRSNQTLLFSSQTFQTKKHVVKLFPPLFNWFLAIFTCTAKKERIPLPAPRSMANFPWKSSGFSTWVSRRVVEGINDGKMSKKQSPFGDYTWHLTLRKFEVRLPAIWVKQQPGRTWHWNIVSTRILPATR